MIGRMVGLPLNRYEALKGVGFAVLVFYSSVALLQSVRGGPFTQCGTLPIQDWIHCAFYTLNEEIVLGALPIFLLSRALPIHPLAIAAIVALGSAAAHFLFFGWIYPERGFLGIVTLLTLFLAALLRNNLIIKFRHVGYAWAVHFGWMSAMFSVGHHLSEPQRFNTHLGATPVLIVVSILALLSCLAIVKERPFKKRRPTASDSSNNGIPYSQKQDRSPRLPPRERISTAGATLQASRD